MTARVGERVPPQNVEAERAVLGAVLLNPSVVEEVIGVLGGDPGVFYVEAHGHLWGVMVGLSKRGQPIDAVTLYAGLQGAGVVEEAGGMAYIASLTGSVGTSASAVHYAEIVREKWLLRQVIARCASLQARAYAPGVVGAEVVAEAEGAMFALGQGASAGEGLRSLEGLIGDVGARMSAVARGERSAWGLMTGYRKLDEMLGGLHAGDMVVLAARPSMGKTALALNIALGVGYSSGKRVAIFSLEMSKEQLCQRLLCAVGEVDSGRLRAGFLGKQEIPKIERAVRDLMEVPIHIDDAVGLTCGMIRSKARRLASRLGGLDLVIIDYLQLIESEGRRGETRQTEVAEISRQVKALGRELGCPVLALSQLSREADKSEGDGPRLSHLRESGAIEQDADVVLMLSKPPKHEAEASGLRYGDQRVMVNIAKQRNGPTGEVALVFRKQYQQFREFGEGPKETGYDRASAEYGRAPLPPVEDGYEEDDELF